MRRRLRVLGTGALAAVLAATALHGSPAASSAASPAAAAAGEEADWTMMIYAVGDTSGVPEVMIQNLAQLTALPEADNVNVVMLIDLPERTNRDAPRSTLPGMEQFTTAKFLELRGDQWVEIGDYGELSMGRPDVLADFIAVAAENYPAQRYGLTLFDHGSGAPGGGYIDDGPPGQSGLTIPQMRAAIGNGLSRAGIDELDLLFHAACLLSSYETASALAPLAETMAGSEEIMVKYPIAPAGFALLAQDRSGAEVGKALIDGYGEFLERDPEVRGVLDVTAMSVVDSAAVQRLDAALQSFADVAVRRMPEIVNQVARARHDALEFVIGFDIQSQDLIDLGDFLRNLRDVPDDVAVARDAAFAALQNAVTAQVTGRATTQATGLNVFLPSSKALATAYLSDGSAPAGWGELVRAYLEAGAGAGQGGQGGQGAGGGFTSSEAEVVVQDDTGILIGAQLRGGSSSVVASETQVIAGFGGQERALAIVLPAYVDAGGPGQVQGAWSYDVTALTDGEELVPVTAGYQAQAGGFIGQMTLRYRSPAGAETDVGATVLLSSEGNIESVSFVDLNNGQAAGISLENGGVLTPYLFVPSSGGFSPVLSEQSIRVNNRFGVTFARFNRGRPFEMGVLVSDVQGSVSSAFTSGEVR